VVVHIPPPRGLHSALTFGAAAEPANRALAARRANGEEQKARAQRRTHEVCELRSV
jgi:hypothetical protein